MGCGCNKGKGAQGFVYTDPEGKTQDVRTEIEAKAMVVRNGGEFTPKK